MQIIYREGHLLGLLCWVDLDSGCSTLSLILLGLMGNGQNWLSSWVRWSNIIDQTQPNPIIRADAPLCTYTVVVARENTEESNPNRGNK